MPELLVFHTGIRETRSIFTPADLEFRSSPSLPQDGRMALSTCSDSRKGSGHSSSLHDPPRIQGKVRTLIGGRGERIECLYLKLSVVADIPGGDD
jgi:hypothetical protein